MEVYHSELLELSQTMDVIVEDMFQNNDEQYCDNLLELLTLSQTIKKIANGIIKDDDEFSDGSYENYIRRFAITIVSHYYRTVELNGNLRHAMLDSDLQGLFDAYYEGSFRKGKDMKTLLYHFIEVVGGKQCFFMLKFVFPMWESVFMKNIKGIED